MRKTLKQQMDRNRRMSIFYVVLVIVLLSALGALLSFSLNYEAWLGAVIAAIVGIVLGLVNWYSGAKIILSISHARHATQYELQLVDNLAEEMAIAAGIPKPQVYIIDDPSPNAFATGRDPEHGVICFTSGILQKLNREELQGVMAHEMAHIRNYDIRLMMTLAVVVGLILMLGEFFRSWVRSTLTRRRSSSSNLFGIFWFLVLSLVFAVIAPFCATLLHMAVSRSREYLADATAAQLTRYPEGLASALEKLASDTDQLAEANKAIEHLYIVNPFDKISNLKSSLMSSHPPIYERIRRLRAGMGSDPLRAYQGSERANS